MRGTKSGLFLGTEPMPMGSAWRPVFDHVGYHCNLLEKAVREKMLLDFVTFRLTTDAGADRAVNHHEGATSALGGFNTATTPASTATIDGRNCTTVTKTNGSESVSGKFCDANSKLGKGMLSFDMTPIASCPGSKHAICRELRPDGNAEPKPICWACRKGYRQENRQLRLAANLQFSRTESFVPWANGVIGRRSKVKAVRLPGIGDMYNVKFVNKVHSIVRANPKTKFWAYTRCWSVPSIWEQLRNLGGEPNMVLWMSWDRKMAEHHGPPPDRKFPWAWLAETDDDLPPEPVELIWRNDGKSSGKQKLTERHTLGGCLVCLHEDGVTKTTCAKCGICWKGEKFRTAKIGKLLEKHTPRLPEDANGKELYEHIAKDIPHTRCPFCGRRFPLQRD